MFNDGESVVSFRTRIKTLNSLKEKLIRNQFYLDYDSAQDALDNLSDLIGIIMQCRFIRNEAELYKQLFEHFTETDSGDSQCVFDKNIFLNLRMPQPQIQRNGFTIFRIDGYYLFNSTRINFELQIKSLVHTFWSEIEHEVVYKNPDFVMYDSFNRNMLGAIRDNLDVVDRQLEIMYKEISYESKRAQIGMDEQGFKVFVARSVNDLVNRKMKESVGFATDFKKCSATIAQYIYIHDFANGENNRDKMITYLEMLSLMKDNPLDFSEVITLERPFAHFDPFVDRLGRYLESQLNVNFQWHVFFTILFTTQAENDSVDLANFCKVIKLLLIQPRWFSTLFASYSAKDAETARNDLMNILLDALIDANTIKIIYEDNLYRCMNIFRSYADKISERYNTIESYMKEQDVIRNDLYHQIAILFH
jgi:ppGpp synthetase/RelA/SpoT-type nucleotidyltranferase